MTDARRERLSISVSAETRAYVRSEAETRTRTESSVVEEAVQRMRRQERELASMRALMADAEEDRRLVQEWSVASPPVTD